MLKRVGYIPHGLAKLGDLWKGILPDYALNGASGGWTVFWYVTSAVIGVALLAGFSWLVVRLYRRRAVRSA
jgi:hypothetical protein